MPPSFVLTFAGKESILQDLVWGGLKIGALRLNNAGDFADCQERDLTTQPPVLVRHTCQQSSAIAGFRYRILIVNMSLV